MTFKVFVYGTLKSGHGNHARLLDNRDGVKFLREARTAPNYRLFAPQGNWYPYAVEVPANAPHAGLAVNGEIYEVSEEILDRLDMLEGYPHHYGRSIVNMEDGEPGVLFYHTEYDKCRNMYFTGDTWPELEENTERKPNAYHDFRGD